VSSPKSHFHSLLLSSLHKSDHLIVLKLDGDFKVDELLLSANSSWVKQRPTSEVLNKLTPLMITGVVGNDLCELESVGY
jgi:hypothetical protein